MKCINSTNIAVVILCICTMGGCKSKEGRLSNAAEAILIKAVATDSQIVHTRATDAGDVELIGVDGENLIPEQTSTTISRWVAGLEELERRNFISSDTSSDGVFAVTADGIKAFRAIAVEVVATESNLE